MRRQRSHGKSSGQECTADSMAPAKEKRTDGETERIPMALIPCPPVHYTFRFSVSPYSSASVDQRTTNTTTKPNQRAEDISWRNIILVHHTEGSSRAPRGYNTTRYDGIPLCCCRVSWSVCCQRRLSCWGYRSSARLVCVSPMIYFPAQISSCCCCCWILLLLSVSLLSLLLSLWVSLYPWSRPKRSIT